MNLLRCWAICEAGGLGSHLRAELARHTRAAAGILPVRLERHSRGNHLLTELAALACLARVWGVPKPGPLFEALERSVGDQFLAAGGHHERSPRYHFDLLRDLMEVLAAWGPQLPARSRGLLEHTVSRGLGFGLWMLHGDGDVGLFNDGALDDGVAPGRLVEAAAALGIRPSGGPEPGVSLRVMREEGFIVAHRGERRLMVDCGPVGPHAQPSHAHCDILSFELSDGPDRILGNRGTSAYSGPDRAGTRGTASHNTVQVDDLEQVELFGDFRLGRRAAPDLLEAGVDGGEVRVRGRFAWPTPTGIVHERTWRFGGPDEGVLLRVTDTVQLDRPDRIVTARFHLPDATRVRADGSVVGFSVGGRRFELRAVGADVSAFAAPWHPQPGASRPGWTVEVRPPRGPLAPTFTTLIRVAADA
jgi:uncharacterized heparinase superfamily protein